MSRLPQSLALWHPQAAVIPNLGTLSSPLAPRLTQILQQIFPASSSLPAPSSHARSASLLPYPDGAALKTSGCFAAAGNPSIAPYGPLPSETVTAGGLAGNEDEQILLQPSATSAQHRLTVQRQLQLGLNRQPVTGLTRPAAVAASKRRPQSAGSCVQLPRAKPSTGPAAKAKKQKSRARSVSPNSQYEFSCTSSVPDEAAGWLMAPRAVGPQQGLSSALEKALAGAGALKQTKVTRKGKISLVGAFLLFSCTMHRSRLRCNIFVGTSGQLP